MAKHIVMMHTGAYAILAGILRAKTACAKTRLTGLIPLAEELRGSVPIESVDHATLVRKAKAAPRTGHHQQ